MSQPHDSRDTSAPAPAPSSWRVTLQPWGQEFQARSDETVLQAALRSGVQLASSCRNGTCRTCIAVLHTGHIRYRIEWPGVSAEEKAEGYFLPCVAEAQSDLVLRPPV